KNLWKTPRSTLGTLTGIHDFLRLLFSTLGTPHCPISQEPLSLQSKEKIIRSIENYPKNRKILLLAPFLKKKKGNLENELKLLLSQGFLRVRLDNTLVEISENLHLDPKTPHDVDIVIDRLLTDSSKETLSRIKESVQTCLEIGKGTFILYDLETKEERIFSERGYSPKSNLSYGPLDPADFSFNHPAGMCENCQGLGEVSSFDLTKIINPDLSIEEDCCILASSYQTIRYKNIYDNLAKIYSFSLSTPWKDLSETAQNIFLYGAPTKKWIHMNFFHPQKKKKWIEFVKWEGVIKEATYRLIHAKSDLYRQRLSKLMIKTACPSCQGSRIKPYPSATRFQGKTLSEITHLTIEEAQEFFFTLSLTQEEKIIGKDLLIEIERRLQFLLDVGLNYLTLERPSPTLSGGEAQRAKLASLLGSGLAGTTYVLDEPSIGLHPKDNHKLLQTLQKLKNQGNTLIIVEHDRETIEEADTIVDFGIGAGIFGGNIIFKGSLQELLQDKTSLTGAYLSYREKVYIPSKRRTPTSFLQLSKVFHHNVTNLSLSIPLGVLCCVTGVSGSGKSSVVSETLYPALSNHLHQSSLEGGKFSKISGVEDAIDRVIFVDQSPIGKSSRSNPATYIHLWDDIRDLFASLPESHIRGFTKGHFSFNVEEGSCPYCKGLGVVKMEMDFLEDVFVECSQCQGKRFDPAILSIQCKGKSIFDILHMDIASAIDFFAAFPKIVKKLQFLAKVGLDYLQLGQSSTTLSGGEAQRIKLAKELSRPLTQKTLYILDEPTTGLHFHDLKKLIHVLQELIEKGNSVLVIEHNLDFILAADYIIDMGPYAGNKGGKIVGEGTPEYLSTLSTPTGIALKESKKKHKFKQKKISEPFPQSMHIKNAEENNLQKISLSLPHQQIIAFCGPSGSGKSSLALDTIHAEGERRYIEALPPYVRQFLKQRPKPKVESITGLTPTIAIEQKSHGANPRSTVGTITEIHDLFRLLFAYLGTPYCPETKEKIETITKETVASKILSLSPKEKIQILSPIEPHKNETFVEFQERLNREGYIRLRLNHIYYELDQKIPWEKGKKQEILLVIDRLIVQENIKKRLLDSLEAASKISNGIILVAKENEDLFFNLRFAVEKTGKSYPSITPQTFSFNSEQGMCMGCYGLGVIYGVNLMENSVFQEKSILDILLSLLKRKNNKESLSLIKKVFGKIPLTSPISSLSKKELSFFLHGSSENTSLRWKGLYPFLEQLGKLGKPFYRRSLASFLEEKKCPSCKGDRLNPLACHVTIDSISLPTINTWPLEKVLSFFQNISLPKEKSFLQESLHQLVERLHLLINMDLSYLSLNRKGSTLSGGEWERIHLSKQLSLGLTFCTYILDEPSIGLHPHHISLLIRSLENLKSQNNTILLIEHDPELLRHSNFLVDFGPKSGKEGGNITAMGTVEDLEKNENSLTGQYLSGKKKIEIPTKRRKSSHFLSVQNITLHNLKKLSLSFPTGSINCLTGLSGSGKSTLLYQVIKPILEKHLLQRNTEDRVETPYGTLSGLSQFDKIITVDQTPVHVQARSDVATYSEILPLIRTYFASLLQSKAKGLLPMHFSSNHRKGMCFSCKGLGYKVVDLQFLPSLEVPCEACKGYRLQPLSLEITYQGKHLGQILEMTVDEASQFFIPFPKIVRKLQMLQETGLGYIKLNQDMSSLSKGEAERIRLSRELSKRSSGKTLYLFDEPSTGLHSYDIEKLVRLFHRLADKNNTLLIIEHNLDIIAQADQIFDLGPAGGENGGRLVVQGTPEEVIKHKTSLTARYLKKHFHGT
ncbi:MAG: excinuclease ABC subunit UvrA, partial [Chlamydiota bacterium]